MIPGHQAPRCVDDVAHREIEALPVASLDVARTHRVIGATHDACLETLEVEARRAFGDGQVQCDRAGHPYLVDVELWVRRDDGARRKVDALACAALGLAWGSVG